MQLRSALEHSDCCMLLADLPAEDREATVARALLVKTLGGSPLKYQVLGSVYFHPPLMNHEILGAIEEPINIIIGNQVETAAAANIPSPTHEILAVGNVNTELGSQGGWTALHQAIWESDVHKVEDLIDLIDLEHEDRYGQRVLHLAPERGNPKIVELLLSRGADPTARCCRKQTPLHRAAWGGSLKVTEMLLNSGVDSNPLDSTDQTPLHLAIQHGYVEVASLLIKQRDASIPNSQALSALRLAVLEGQNEIMKCLVGLSHDINAPDGQGCTLLHLAARTGDAGLVEWLLHRGSDVTLRNSDGLRPLHLAAEGGNDAALRLLLSEDFDRGLLTGNLQTEEWGDILHSASKGGIEWLVSDILRVDKRKAHIWDPQGRRALHIAAEAGNTRVATLLLDAQGDAVTVDVVDASGRTPLFYAAKSGQVSVAKQLIQRGANVTVADANGETPFEHAAISNHAAVLKLLLEKGAALGLKHRRGNSYEQGHPSFSNKDQIKIELLHEVVRSGHTEILRLLFENGVKEKTFNLEMIRSQGYINMKNQLLVEAARHGHVLILKLLLEQGANINVYDVGSNMGEGGHPWESVLYRASEAGHFSAVQFLLSNEADVDPPDHAPLVGAALHGHEDIVRLLLKENAKINRGWDCHRRTALSAAASNGHLDLVNLLLRVGAVAEPPLEESPPSDRVEVPIVVAAEGGHEGVVRLLLEEKANVDRVMVEETPYATAETGRELGAGFRYPRMPMSTKRTALAAAAANGHLEIVRLLLQRDASLDADLGLDRFRRSVVVANPLVEAARFGHKTVVDVLIRERADAKRPDLVERALSGAAEGGHMEVVELLLKECACASDGDTDLSRAMHNATRRGHPDIVRLLMKHGAEMPVGQ